MFGRKASQHPLSEHLLTHHEGRRRQIEQAVYPRLTEFLNRVNVIAWAAPEISVVPHVLADRYTDSIPAELEDRRSWGRFKVAIFIKDVVGRQQSLVVAVHDLAVAQQRSCIE